jgi:ABC-2 type transport system permease protein
MSMLGLAPISSNSFGLEGPGCQLYFIAPIRMRDVFIAKNIFCLAVGFIEAVLVYAVISFNTARPSLFTILSTLLWVTATLLLLMTMGNRRSITAAKKIEVGRAASRQASQASALIAMGVLLVCAGISAGLYAAEWYFEINWLTLPGLAIFAAVAVAVYRAGLNSIDQFSYDNREQLFAELCKQ